MEHRGVEEKEVEQVLRAASIVREVVVEEEEEEEGTQVMTPHRALSRLLFSLAKPKERRFTKKKLNSHTHSLSFTASV